MITSIAGKSCFIYGKTGSPVLYWSVAAQEVETAARMAALLRAQAGEQWLLVAFPVEDWGRELSPWQAPAPSGGEMFGGEGSKTLAWLTEHGMPFVCENYGAQHLPHFIGGYSLAGLFSLWACYESPALAGAASCSGSLWYPGWEEYCAARRFSRPMYLSLGRKEPLTRNSIMASVGSSTQKQFDRVQREGEAPTAFVWHPGGHFHQPTERMAEGFVWLLRHKSQ